LPHLRGAAVSVPTSALLFLVISPGAVDWTAWNLQAVGIFAAVGALFPVLVTILAFEANRRLGPSLTCTVSNLAPLFAVVFAIVILRKVRGQWRLIGISVIVRGSGPHSRGHLASNKVWLEEMAEPVCRHPDPLSHLGNNCVVLCAYA